MFLVSAALVGVAIVLLLVGMITAKLILVYLAIGVSVVSMIILGLGIFLQREVLWGKERQRAGAGGVAEEQEEAKPVAAASAGRQTARSEAVEATSAEAKPAAGSGPTRSARRAPAGTTEAATGTQVGGEVVHVVPGRRRYHRAGCMFLEGRVSEELTVGEAQEEGFSGCTACFPPESAAEPESDQAAVASPRSAAGEAAAAQDAAPAKLADVEPAHGTALRHTKPRDTKPSKTEPREDSGPDAASVPAAGAGPVAGSATDAGTVPGASAEHPADGSGSTAPGPADAGPADAGPARGPADSSVWVVRGVSRYHRSDCVLIRSVDDDDVDKMPRADAESAGCTPCRACHVDESAVG